MNLVLDAGALIGIERDDHRTAALIELGRRAGATLVTAAPIVGQVWRGTSRQARLARTVRMIDIRVSDLDAAKAAGALLAATGTDDIVDALLVGTAMPGDQVLTSDPDDIERLVSARGIPITVVRV